MDRDLRIRASDLRLIVGFLVEGAGQNTRTEIKVFGPGFEPIYNLQLVACGF